jgi:hypothetical protein
MAAMVPNCARRNTGNASASALRTIARRLLRVTNQPPKALPNNPETPKSSNIPLICSDDEYVDVPSRGRQAGEYAPCIGVWPWAAFQHLSSVGFFPLATLLTPALKPSGDKVGDLATKRPHFVNSRQAQFLHHLIGQANGQCLYSFGRLRRRFALFLRHLQTVSNTC